jgi:hypothetical protein
MLSSGKIQRKKQFIEGAMGLDSGRKKPLATRKANAIGSTQKQMAEARAMTAHLKAINRT